MDLIDKVEEIADRIGKMKESVQTEEASKNAFVMPLISALGYDVFNPFEVVPEFTADIGTKKGEKVDYAILKDEKPIIIIECKHWKEKLDVHKTQLHRYFHVTDAKFGLLTNGIEYRFFTDIESPNKMDDTPFLTVNFEDFTEGDIGELKKFTKDKFDVSNILSAASDLKYSKQLKAVIKREMSDPSDEFVKLLSNDVYAGRMTQQVKDQFKVLVKRAAKNFINDSLNDRLKSVMGDDYDSAIRTQAPLPAQQANTAAVQVSEDVAVAEEPELTEAEKKGIFTTEEELEGYRIIQAIVRRVVGLEKIAYRDTKSYFGVLFEDNNRKPVCRLHFNAKQKYVGTFDADKNETRNPISDLSEIYNYESEILDIVKSYL
ncbi:type I restriction endonuclease [Flammeovirga sp. SJP92]|uniref:type I restriction endonuclease n=1 Tax=Flammeovirga sp. SJP92 TaxID=1775430 RepID=UPI000787145B|nr:type I restriction endonuclease [Flammeovirga sp. SJP92]KXX70937.1 restriction endonuclease [Flammeovirga sp. SJP92]